MLVTTATRMLAANTRGDRNRTARAAGCSRPTECWDIDSEVVCHCPAGGTTPICPPAPSAFRRRARSQPASSRTKAILCAIDASSHALSSVSSAAVQAGSSRLASQRAAHSSMSLWLSMSLLLFVDVPPGTLPGLTRLAAKHCVDEAPHAEGNVLLDDLLCDAQPGRYLFLR